MFAFRTSSAPLALLVLPVLGSCAASSAEMTAARSAAYQGTFEEVWAKVQDSLAEEFPVVQELDAEHHRILTCWHSIDRKMDNVTAGDINGDRLFFRAAIQLSEKPPWRVVVTGRAAHLTLPQIMPFKHDDPAEPSWVDGRTERVTLAIHRSLQPVDGPAAAAAPAAPAAYDPDAIENIAGSCVVGDTTGIPVQHMSGISIARKPGAK